MAGENVNPFLFWGLMNVLVSWLSFQRATETTGWPSPMYTALGVVCGVIASLNLYHWWSGGR